MPEYGHAHRKERQRLARIIATQGYACCRCGKQLPPGAPFQLDHRDDDPSLYLGPAEPFCNMGAGGAKARRNDRRRRIRTRNW